MMAETVSPASTVSSQASGVTASHSTDTTEATSSAAQAAGTAGEGIVGTSIPDKRGCRKRGRDEEGKKTSSGSDE
uniref:Uncharacterized protein n=1 Tax=Chromera velia CCMP2878 TaxID=1169474 RepID=A0A0G4I6Q8_9ALVE|eukprot:Cvel_36391.t1-p1 / transcript=Cvel_36391.t1 / gene=Cvel_36391 / organism=Chromera_velia_CCMP2878 / gene_product=hypothetical protein / transcript_product=hypothetical protein / location=Cvel_scaffold7205:1115-1565(+) / protein_length=74 / sequence_SO=supercontig / SO=protein_coding / is_pseudo=false